MEEENEVFCRSGWEMRDILATFCDVTPEEARQFLIEHERRIFQGMVKGGWEVILWLGEERGWREREEPPEDYP